MGHCFYFIDLQNPQIRFPAMKFKQWVMIGTEISRCALTTDGFIEHSAEGRPIDVAALNAESDNATRKLVHDRQHPVALKNN